MTDFCDIPREIERTAVISQCGAYRYSLTRKWGRMPLLPFVMLNPSTADAVQDDPTIRRCMGFARRENAGGIIVVNLYAFRAARPKDLWRAENPVGGVDRERALVRVVAEAARSNQPIVCAWGAHGADIANFTIQRLKCDSARLVCLGKTKAGAPRHPLYVRADEPLEPFP